MDISLTIVCTKFLLSRKHKENKVAHSFKNYGNALLLRLLQTCFFFFPSHGWKPHMKLYWKNKPQRTGHILFYKPHMEFNNTVKYSNRYQEYFIFQYSVERTDGRTDFVMHRLVFFYNIAISGLPSKRNFKRKRTRIIVFVPEKPEILYSYSAQTAMFANPRT